MVTLFLSNGETQSPVSPGAVFVEKNSARPSPSAASAFQISSYSHPIAPFLPSWLHGVTLSSMVPRCLSEEEVMTRVLRDVHECYVPSTMHHAR